MYKAALGKKVEQNVVETDAADENAPGSRFRRLRAVVRRDAALLRPNDEKVFSDAFACWFARLQETDAALYGVAQRLQFSDVAAAVSDHVYDNWR